MYRIDQKVTEYENQGKKPGSKYVQDMLRASALYSKKDLDKLYSDLCVYIKDNANQIIHLEIKSQPFQVAVITYHEEAIICEFILGIKGDTHAEKE